MPALLARGDEPMIAAQVLVEFWVVATRPVSVNGFGWTVDQTHAALLSFRAQFALLEDTPEVLTRWMALVVSSGVQGKRAHDALGGDHAGARSRYRAHAEPKGL